MRPHLTPATCIYPGDDAPTTTHLGLFIGDEHCGIVSLYGETLPDHPGTGYRFRALAVVDELRGRGLGKTLLEATERLAQAQGAAYLWANARMTAVDFYRKAGYAVGAEEFLVEGVGPHRIVLKTFLQRGQ